MRKFSEATRLFLGSIKQDRLEQIAPIPQSVGFISPGDVLVFNYMGLVSKSTATDRVALVLGGARGMGAGVFISTKGNPLVLCVNLTGSANVASLVLSKLYKNRKKCSYAHMTGTMKLIFGMHNVRTYNLRKMYRLHELSVDKEDLLDGE